MPQAPYVVAYNSPHALNLGQGGEEYAYSCISYAKFVLGRLNEKWGNAKDLKATAENPYVGGLVLTTESRWGHVAVITAIKGTQLEVIEGNWIAGQVSTRSISLDEEFIRGFK